MEMLYQYLWKYRLLSPDLATTDGRSVTVLNPGRHNLDAGPDFSGARLRIGGQEWAGNVEVHVRASDWFRHGHDSDPAYGNVILHVVGVNDARIPDGHGGFIPQLTATFPEQFVTLYARLAEKISDVECADLLPSLPPLAVTSWLDILAVERMQQKSQRVLDTLAQVEGDWERTCFITLARALGFGLNAEPLEMLARSIPLKFLARHSDDIVQLEALLLGQAGLLDTSIHIFDEYYQLLCREYFFLARKYGLKPLRRDIWKFARTRPQNFPIRRIAMLAQSVSGGFSLLSRILETRPDSESLAPLFDWRLSEYWATHIDFDQPGTRLPMTLSHDNITLLLINLVAPMLYAHGASRSDPDFAERGLDLWRDLEPENNSIIRRWTAAGIPCTSATDSQALLQLRREYCDRSRCLDCRFGHTLLRSASHNPPVYAHK